MKKKQKTENSIVKIIGQYRQGDVLIERVDSLPLTEQIKGRVILAHGEVTGHAHEVTEIDAADLWKTEPTERTATQMALRVKKNTVITHQEHAEIPVKIGNYRVTRQREYLPEGSRNVAD